MELARFAHLPLGALAADWVLGTADALFARCLREAGHLLWLEDATLPDLAGKGGAETAPPSPEDMLALDGQKRAEVSPCPLNRAPPTTRTACQLSFAFYSLVLRVCVCTGARPQSRLQCRLAANFAQHFASTPSVCQHIGHGFPTLPNVGSPGSHVESLLAARSKEWPKQTP